MNPHQIRAHTPRHIIPEDHALLRRHDAEPTERPADHGWAGMFIVIGLVLPLAVTALGLTAQAGWLAHNVEVLGDE